MQALRELEVAVNLFFQSFGPGFTTLMRGITFFGDELFYILLMPAVYWCLDALAGARIGMMLLLSGSLNGVFKFLGKGPRPYWISDKVTAVVHESSFGMPSGHAMNSTAVWGQVAVEGKKKWIGWICALLVVLIGISRLCMGVHFLSDVVVGFLLGGLLLLAFQLLHKAFEKWLWGLSLVGQLFLALGACLLMLALPLGARALSSAWQMPADWALRLGGADPFSMKGTITTAGVFLGMAGGFIFLRAKQGLLQSAEGGWKRLWRYLLGVVGIVVFYAGLGKLFPKDLGLLSDLLRFLRYFLIGLWISCLAPLLFVRLKIGRIAPVEG